MAFEVKDGSINTVVPQFNFDELNGAVYAASPPEHTTEKIFRNALHPVIFNEFERLLIQIADLLGIPTTGFSQLNVGDILRHLKSRIDNLDGTAGTIGSDLADVITSITDLNSAMADLESELDTQVSNLNGQIISILGSISTLQNSLSTLESTLQGQIDVHTTDILALQNTTSNLQISINNLEARIIEMLNPFNYAITQARSTSIYYEDTILISESHNLVKIPKLTIWNTITDETRYWEIPGNRWLWLEQDLFGVYGFIDSSEDLLQIAGPPLSTTEADTWKWVLTAIRRQDGFTILKQHDRYQVEPDLDLEASIITHTQYTATTGTPEVIHPMDPGSNFIYVAVKTLDPAGVTLTVEMDPSSVYTSAGPDIVYDPLWVVPLPNLVFIYAKIPGSPTNIRFTLTAGSDATITVVTEV